MGDENSRHKNKVVSDKRENASLVTSKFTQDMYYSVQVKVQHDIVQVTSLE